MTTTTTTPITSTPRRAGRPRRLATAAVATSAIAALVATPSAAADTPPLPADTHCPAGYKLLTIASFPSVYDDFLHAQDLNGNQLVCSHQFVDAAAAALLPKFPVLPPGSALYLVTDDSIVR